MSTFEEYYRRLAVGGRAEVEVIWQELLTTKAEPWYQFWRGARSLLDPYFTVEEGFRPELAFLTLAESYAVNHPISLEAASWLARGEFQGPWLQRKFPPKKPVNRPFVIACLREEFDQFVNYMDVLALSEDGTSALTRSSNAKFVRHWDLVAGESRAGGVQKGLLLPLADRKALTICEGQVTLRDWDMAVLAHYPDFPFAPRAASCTRDGKRLVGVAVADSQWQILVTEPESGRLLSAWKLEQAVHSYCDLTISDNGRFVALLDQGVALIWRLDKSGKPIRRFQYPEFFRSLCARSMIGLTELAPHQASHSRWGRYAAIDMHTGREFDLEVPPSKPGGAAFSGRLVAATHQEGDHLQASPMRLWSLATERAELLHRFRLPKRAGELAMNEDQSTLVAYSSDYQLRVFDLSSQSLGEPLGDHHSTINKMCCSADGRILATGSTDQTVKVFDLQQGTCVGSFSGEGTWPSPRLSLDGRWLLAKSLDTCKLCDLLQHKVRLGDFDLCETSALVVEREENKLVARDPATWEVLSRYEYDSTIDGFSCSPYDTLVAVAHQDGVIQVWDPKLGQVVRRLEFIDPKTGKATYIRSLGWHAASTVYFFPNVSSNFEFGWDIESPQAREGCGDRRPPKAQSHTFGESPGGVWSYRIFTRENWSIDYLRLTHQATGHKLHLPWTGRALFTSDEEIVLGCETGEIMVFAIKGELG